MGSDPAFLFYPGDWMGGTILFSRAHKGAYMDLLMAQFNNGHLALEDIKVILGSDFDIMWESKLKAKFIQDDKGLFFNEKLDKEVIRRRNYSASRKKNLESHMNPHMGNHTETRMETGNETITKDERDNGRFEEIWDKYPRKERKKQAIGHFNASIRTDEDWKNINIALDHYKAKLKKEQRSLEYTMQGGTWFNNWQDYVEKIPEEQTLEEYIESKKGNSNDKSE